MRVLNKRIEKDVMELMMSDHEVTLIKDSLQNFYVKFYGPKDTPYMNGIWNVRVELPDQYPIKSPSIGFINKIYHPNIDEESGSICLDVINQTWSPMFGLQNIFENFLPHLLRYANPTDPLNINASNDMINNEKKYIDTVKQYVIKYAKKNIMSSEVDKFKDYTSNSDISDLESMLN